MLPLDYSEKLKVSLSGRKAVVTTAAGITVTFDWRSRAHVTLPSSYQGAVCGLCGNYNEKREDDMSTPSGQITESGSELGESWQVALTPGCSTACRGPRCQECSGQQKSKYEAQEYCGVIAQKTGPFQNCHKQLDPGPFLKDCVFDACQYHGHFGAICEALQGYASACDTEGVAVDAWRREDFCRESDSFFGLELMMHCLTTRLNIAPYPPPLLHSNGMSSQQPLHSVRFGLSNELCQLDL